MNENLRIAVIAALSALLGSLIPTIAAFFDNAMQRDVELAKALTGRQNDTYLELMLALQEFVNKTGNAEFEALQKVQMKVAIFGDDKTSAAFSAYYDDLVQSAGNIRPVLSGEEHQRHQKAILNGMRVSMGLPPLERFQIVSFRPDKKKRGA
jgi:hypothetical protein